MARMKGHPNPGGNGGPGKSFDVSGIEGPAAKDVTDSRLVNWLAGPGVQLEIISTATGRQPGHVGEPELTYKLNYVPPWHPAVRARMKDILQGGGAFHRIGNNLKAVERSLGDGDELRGREDCPPDELNENRNTTKRALENLASSLFDKIMVSEHSRDELSEEQLFLDIGIDKELLDYPWELMRDRTGFYCLKHFVGRYVTGSEDDPQQRPARQWRRDRIKDLSLLLIVVPQPREGGFRKLKHAESEMIAIERAVDGKLKNLKVLYGEKAIFDEVRDALVGKQRYHIVHFCGHAELNKEDPEESQLRLYDVPMTTQDIRDLVPRNRPILCFINACNSAAFQGGDRFNAYGLGKAFLDTGAYLLGSHWKIGDDEAKAFAETFYNFFLQEKSLGESVLLARKACKAVNNGRFFDWASYVLYGDPRVYFQKTRLERDGVRVNSQTMNLPRSSVRVKL